MKTTTTNTLNLDSFIASSVPTNVALEIMMKLYENDFSVSDHNTMERGSGSICNYTRINVHKILSFNPYDDVIYYYIKYTYENFSEGCEDVFEHDITETACLPVDEFFDRFGKKR